MTEVTTDLMEQGYQYLGQAAAMLGSHIKPGEPMVPIVVTLGLMLAIIDHSNKQRELHHFHMRFADAGKT